MSNTRQVKVVDTRIVDIEYCEYSVDIPEDLYEEIFKDSLSITQEQFDSLAVIVGGVGATIEKDWKKGSMIAVPMKARDIFAEEQVMCNHSNENVAPMETYVHPLIEHEEHD